MPHLEAAVEGDQLRWAYWWGDNAFGQFGEDATTDSSGPVKVAGQP